jgi:hypothetical protein
MMRNSNTPHFVHSVENTSLSTHLSSLTASSTLHNHQSNASASPIHWRKQYQDAIQLISKLHCVRCNQHWHIACICPVDWEMVASMKARGWSALDIQHTIDRQCEEYRCDMRRKILLQLVPDAFSINTTPDQESNTGDLPTSIPLQESTSHSSYVIPVKEAEEACAAFSKDAMQNTKSMCTTSQMTDTAQISTGECNCDGEKNNATTSECEKFHNNHKVRHHLLKQYRCQLFKSNSANARKRLKLRHSKMNNGNVHFTRIMCAHSSQLQMKIKSEQVSQNSKQFLSRPLFGISVKCIMYQFHFLRAACATFAKLIVWCLAKLWWIVMKQNPPPPNQFTSCLIGYSANM